MTDRPGPRLSELLLPGDGSAWVDLGFTVSDDTIELGQLTLTLGHEQISLGLDNGPSDSDLPDRWLDLPVTPTPPDLRDEAGTAVHPNHVIGVDHVVLLTPDAESTIATIDAIGWTVRRERPSSMAGIDVIQRFVWAGEVLLEIVTPIEPTPAAAAASVWGISLVSADLDATADLLGDRLTRPRDAVQSGRKIAAIKGTRGELPLAVAVMTPHRRPTDDDPPS